METGNSVTGESTGAQEHFDLSFAKEPASSYLLLIQLSNANLKACWYHINKNLVTGFAQYPLEHSTLDQNELSALLDRHPFLRSEFHQCIVSLDTDNQSLVPNSIIGDLDQHELREAFQSNSEPGFRNTSHKLVNLSAHVDYPMPEWLDLWLKNHLSNPLCIPSVAPMIEWGFNHLKSSTSNDLALLRVGQDWLDLILFKDQKLTLCNRFSQTAAEDICYYLLYCSEIAAIDPEQCPLHLMGECELGSESWKLIATYWKQMSMLQPIKKVSISQAISEKAKSTYAELTYSLLCAS